MLMRSRGVGGSGAGGWGLGDHEVEHVPDRLWLGSIRLGSAR
jgi:hypothetical protein